MKSANPASLIRRLLFSVGVRITLIFALMIVLFLGFSFFNQGMLERFLSTYSSQVSGHAAVLRIKSHFADCNTALSDYLKTGNRTRLSDFNTSSSLANIEITALYPSVPGDEAYYLLRSIENSFATYFREASTASFLYNTKNYAYYSRMYYAESINAYLQRYCDELLGLVLQDSVVTGERLVDAQQALWVWNILISVVMLLLFFFFLAHVTLQITRPLGRLVSQARAISTGNFNARVTVRNPDNSIGVLSSTFNKMAENIKSMMESIQENVETEKRLLAEQRKNLEYRELLNQATFLALQTQTNPHFLFNTLSSISRTITLGKGKQSVEMIDSLSSLLRYSLGDASHSVSLEDELAVTQNYLHIQHLRFEDRLRLSIEVDSALAKKTFLPRFTLQPLVENAVIHGIEPREEGGLIRIRAVSRSGSVLLSIFDDGPGIPAETLKAVFSNTETYKARHIGIWNTRKRVQLFTQRPESFRIASRASGGTLIRIRLTVGDARVHTTDS